MENDLRAFLNAKVDLFNQPSFIKDDPISIPHRFSKKQDKEIAGLFAALFAWGNRTIIINKSNDLLSRMDNAPHEFIVHHQDADLKTLLGFKHRTFTDTDILYLVSFLHHHYSHHDSLESAFTKGMSPGDPDVENGLNIFHQYVFSLEHVPGRTKKHIASPGRNSSCKRLNMFLRWMVRNDTRGVDFGIWKNIRPDQLICPIDLHVARVAKRFGLLQRKPVDWLAAKELTTCLKLLDNNDPVKYDFALFGLGVEEEW